MVSLPEINVRTNKEEPWIVVHRRGGQTVDPACQGRGMPLVHHLLSRFDNQPGCNLVDAGLYGVIDRLTIVIGSTQQFGGPLMQMDEALRRFIAQLFVEEFAQNRGAGIDDGRLLTAMGHKEILLLQIVKVLVGLRGRHIEQFSAQNRSHLLQHTGIFEKRISRQVVFEDLIDHIGEEILRGGLPLRDNCEERSGQALLELLQVAQACAQQNARDPAVESEYQLFGLGISERPHLLKLCQLVDLRGSKPKMVNAYTRDHLPCQKLRKVEIRDNPALDDQHTPWWKLLKHMADQSIDFVEFVDLLVVAEQDREIFGNFRLYGAHQRINDHIEVVHDRRVIGMLRGGTHEQGIEGATKVGKTVTNALQQNSENGDAIGIGLVEKIPATGEAALLGKIDQQGGLPIAGRSV